MHSLVEDLRYALRQLRRSPGFALTIIVTLALGIGVSATVASATGTSSDVVAVVILARRVATVHPVTALRTE